MENQTWNKIINQSAWVFLSYFYVESADYSPFWRPKKKNVVIWIAVVDFVTTHNKNAIVNSEASVVPKSPESIFIKKQEMIHLLRIIW